MPEAEAEYMKLLNRNAENRQYYLGLEEARQLREDTPARLQMYAELQEKYPRSTLARRIPLNYAEGDHFRRRVDKYLRHALHKGAPPLFVDLRSLYSCQLKVAVIQELLTDYVDNLQRHEHFSTQGRAELTSSVAHCNKFLVNPS